MNRIGAMPISNLPPDKRLLAKNIMVFFDETAEANKVIKRIVVIVDKQNKGLVIDSMAQIGVIDVSGKEDGYGNVMWYPRQKIGLFRKLSIEKLNESGTINDPRIRDAINFICAAENSNRDELIPASEVLLLAKLYIERYPVSGGMQ